MGITLKSIIKGLDVLFHSYMEIVIGLLAGIGFLTGSFSLALWFIENTGELPQFLIYIFKGFGLMIEIFLIFLTIKIILWVIKKSTPSINNFLEERKEKREIRIEQYHNAFAKSIAREINKTKRRGKK